MPYRIKSRANDLNISLTNLAEMVSAKLPQYTRVTLTDLSVAIRKTDGTKKQCDILSTANEILLAMEKKGV